MKVENPKLYESKFFLFLSTIFLSSCVSSYVPNAVNSPLLTKKHEFQAAVYSGTAGIDPQIAYAVTNHWGLMVNASFADRTNDSTNNFHKHNFVEFGSGYFSQFGKNGVVEIYGGYGFGNLEARYESGIFLDYANLQTRRLFIQPGIGMSGEIFDGSFTPRISVVTLSQNSTSKTAVFFEPTVTGKVGYRYFRFVFQFGLSTAIYPDTIDFGYEPFIISLGFQAIIGRKYGIPEN